MESKWRAVNNNPIDDATLRRMAMNLAKHVKKMGYHYADLSFLEDCASVTIRNHGNEDLKSEWRFIK